MTQLMPVSLLVAMLGCSAAPEVPRKVFDFSAQSLTGAPVSRPSTSASPKHHLRHAIATARPAIAECVNRSAHGAGTVELQVAFAVDGDRGTIHSVDVTTSGDPALAQATACIREAALAIGPLAVELPDAEMWVAHAPFTVDANYSASR